MTNTKCRLSCLYIYKGILFKQFWPKISTQSIKLPHCPGHNCKCFFYTIFADRVTCCCRYKYSFFMVEVKNIWQVRRLSLLSGHVTSAGKVDFSQGRPIGKLPRRTWDNEQNETLKWYAGIFAQLTDKIKSNQQINCAWRWQLCERRNV